MLRNTRRISWIKGARKDFEDFPQAAQTEMARALTVLAEGRMPDIVKPLTGFGSGGMELALKHRGDAFGSCMRCKLGMNLGGSRVSEEIEVRNQNAEAGYRLDRRMAPAAEGDVEMSGDMEIVRSTGNVFPDLGHLDADREQLRALLAARIIGLLDDRKLSVRAAKEITGVAAADFSRIRKANLGRFTIDRLMTILSALGQEVEVTVNVRPRRMAA
jgi:predicted XRE-type DNA-binding protein